MAKSKGDKYWLNGEGYADPTVAEVIKKDSIKTKMYREKIIGKLIDSIKNMLKAFDLELIERIKIRDKNTGKEYR